jgi:hypothetical protein
MMHDHGHYLQNRVDSVLLTPLIHLIMKSLLCLTLSSLLSALASAQVAAPPAADGTINITDWVVIGDKAKAFGPTQDGGNIIFTGPAFGDKGRSEAAFFPKTDLAEGETLELNAKASFTGVSGMGNFRFGIYQKRSRDHSRGWLGYTAYAGIDKKFPKGGLFASEPGNDDSYDKATTRVLGESTVPFRNIKDDVYFLNMTLKMSNGQIEVSASLSPEATPGVPIAQYSGVDSQPATSTFDALGFNTHELLSSDTFELSDVSLKLLPNQP